VGAVGGLTDRELLEMFTVRPGEAAESAFAAIVERHGPMVHRVCRQVLGNAHDADDAFQATFLILIRKASLLNLSDSLQRFTLVLHIGQHAGTNRGCPGVSRGAAPCPRHYRAGSSSWP
jgi:hypothetical protein